MTVPVFAATRWKMCLRSIWDLCPATVMQLELAAAAEHVGLHYGLQCLGLLTQHKSPQTCTALQASDICHLEPSAQ